MSGSTMAGSWLGSTLASAATWDPLGLGDEDAAIERAMRDRAQEVASLRQTVSLLQDDRRQTHASVLDVVASPRGVAVGSGAAPAEPIGKRAATLPQGASPAEAYGFVGFVLTGASSATTRDRGFRPQILVVTPRFSRRRIRDAAFRREGATSAATDAEARDTRTRQSLARALLTS